MSSKRALVVDDSKSARAFLSRILERHEITVDAAESAEAAIDYLTRNKPDVIFMDHMMPGMDGFQAVQTIKNNPRTSAIPILMYTSQEGDLYLGQARALGAEGVLPKQIKQADVTRMLFQLRLVSDRRERERDQTTFTALENVPDLMPANESAIIVPINDAAIVVQSPTGEMAPAVSVSGAPAQDALAELLPKLSLEIRAAVDATLQKELSTLRSYIGGTLEKHAERVQGDLAALMPAPRDSSLDTPTMIPERRVGAVIGWTLAVLGLAAAGVMSWMWWSRGGELAAIHTDLTAAYAELETLRARPVAVVDAAAPVDPNAVTPAADAPDAAVATTADVALVPNGGTVTPPATAVATPVTGEPVSGPINGAVAPAHTGPAATTTPPAPGAAAPVNVMPAAVPSASAPAHNPAQ